MEMEFSHDFTLERKIKAVESAIYENICEINTWHTRQGFYASPSEYTNLSEWEEISIGDRWWCSDDITRWFKSTVVIPGEFAGKNVVLELDFGGEGLVKINGVIQSALVSFIGENEARRTRVMFPGTPKANESFEIEVEAGLNYGEFSRLRKHGKKEVEYQLRRAWLAVVNDSVERYYFDIKAAYETMKALRNPIEKIVDTNVNLTRVIPLVLMRFFESSAKDSYICHKILDAVLHSLTAIDADNGRRALVESIEPASKVLWDKLSNISHNPHALIKFVGQAHIDTAWLWPVKETIRKCGRTIANVLDLMDRYNELVFAFSQPQLFEYTKEYYPELYDRLKKMVERGKFELVGNAWVEMDCNIPSGESLVRQLLYGRAFFMREFGKDSKVFWMPDVFGYSWALPQIIKRSGMEYFFTSKLINNNTNKFPHSLFVWQGIDGTRILSYVQRLGYNGRYDPETIETIYNRFEQKHKTENLLMTFGYGDGGGGPSYQMLEMGRRLKSFPGLQKTEINTAASFFDAVNPVKESLPVWNDEMYFEHHRGTYTSQANIKKNNRRAELAIRQAEMLATIANERLGAEYPYEDILKAYKIILRNQFHDILPGSSIRAVYEDCEKEYKQAFEIINAIQNTAVKKLTAMSDCNIVTVWNSLSWKRCGYVSVPLPEGFNDVTVVDENSNEVPSAVINGEVEFEASVPALAFAKYAVVEKSAVKPAAKFAAKSDPKSGPAESMDMPICVRAGCMENKFYRIRLDRYGNLTSIYDKRNCCEVLEQGRVSNLLQIFEDKPRGETAWNIDIEYQNKGWDLMDGNVQVLEQTAVKGVIRVVRKFNLSTIVQDVTIYRSIPRIDFKTKVDWHETEKMLKAAFFVNVLSSKAAYEIQFGSIERPTHWNTSYDKAKFEVCAHKWADLSEGGYGVSILNDSRYGYDIKDNRMRITLLRAPVDPDPTADRGMHEFCYSLMPHAGDYRDAETVNAGYELNVPLMAIAGHSAGIIGSYASISRKNVIIDTIKCAEDGRGIIMRVYESAGIRGNTNISLSAIPGEVYECNLMEEDENLMGTEGNSFSFHIKPFEIKTFRICRLKMEGFK
jgi:alpha-mannosidase